MCSRQGELVGLSQLPRCGQQLPGLGECVDGSLATGQSRRSADTKGLATPSRRDARCLEDIDAAQWAPAAQASAARSASSLASPLAAGIRCTCAKRRYPVPPDDRPELGDLGPSWWWLLARAASSTTLLSQHHEGLAIVPTEHRLAGRPSREPHLAISPCGSSDVSDASLRIRAVFVYAVPWAYRTPGPITRSSHLRTHADARDSPSW